MGIFTQWNIRHKAKSPGRERSNRRMRGFTMIEFVASSAILTTGLLGLAVLLAAGIQSTSLGGNTNAALALAQSKVEDLRNLSSSSAARADGGSLTSSLTGYSDTSGIFTRRWELSAGPGGAQICRVRVLPTNAQNTTRKTVELSTLIR